MGLRQRKLKSSGYRNKTGLARSWHKKREETSGKCFRKPETWEKKMTRVQVNHVKGLKQDFGPTVTDGPTDWRNPWNRSPLRLCLHITNPQRWPVAWIPSVGWSVSHRRSEILFQFFHMLGLHQSHLLFSCFRLPPEAFSTGYFIDYLKLLLGQIKSKVKLLKSNYLKVALLKFTYGASVWPA